MKRINITNILFIFLGVFVTALRDQIPSSRLGVIYISKLSATARDNKRSADLCQLECNVNLNGVLQRLLIREVGDSPFTADSFAGSVNCIAGIERGEKSVECSFAR